jgi:hypothetical protein
MLSNTDRHGTFAYQLGSGDVTGKLQHKHIALVIHQ